MKILKKIGASILATAMLVSMSSMVSANSDEPVSPETIAAMQAGDQGITPYWNNVHRVLTELTISPAGTARIETTVQDFSGQATNIYVYITLQRKDGSTYQTWGATNVNQSSIVCTRLGYNLPSGTSYQAKAMVQVSGPNGPTDYITSYSSLVFW